MKFDFRYYGSSAVKSSATGSQMAFAPDTTRPETFFEGEIGDSLLFREAMGALHEVVVSDLRFKPKDRSAYKAWAERQLLNDQQQLAAKRGNLADQVRGLQQQLDEIDRSRRGRWNNFYSAQQRYFDYLYKRDYDAWLVLDPVITVHPDEVFFECFSQDESSYARLSVGYDSFRTIKEHACGTTNVDYSAALYDEMQKIRRYKTTRLTVDPSGFTVATEDDDAYKEVKIDLPDSWVRGFLQVSSAMTLPMKSIELHPLDVHNLCLVLRRRREKQGPRAMRWLLRPGQPVSVVLEPWEHTVHCPRSVYLGNDEDEIRTWGRRRIHVLERLIPVVDKFEVHLLGRGLPSFFVAERGTLRFTLGLSGWTANDWSRAGNFDLMAARADVDAFTKRRVFEELSKSWAASPGELADKLQLQPKVISSALNSWVQAGRVVYDLTRGVYRKRELSREPLPLEQLRFNNAREESAWRFLNQNHVRLKAAEARQDGGRTLHATVKDRYNVRHIRLVIDGDERLIEAECSCSFYIRNRLHQGPCEHMLAVRLRHAHPATKAAS